MVASLRTRSLVLGASAAFALSLCLAAATQAQTPEAGGGSAPGSAKESPYAAAKDDDDAPLATAAQSKASATERLGGQRIAGSRKDSPYAAAKDENAVSVEPTLNRLWGLILPVLLAGGSYAWLRSSEARGQS